MDEKAILTILLGEFYNQLDHLDDRVIRDAHFPEAPDAIKVAIGMRRVGKTSFLYQHSKKLLKEGVNKSSILYVNCEDDRLFPLDHAALARLIDSFYVLYPENLKQRWYIFLDGIEHVVGWPTVIRRLHDTGNVEIFLTASSSATELSKELATHFRGRSSVIELWPYSFKEYSRSKNHDLLKQHFMTYLSEGGFPEVTTYAQLARQQTLQDYVDLVIYRDIVKHHKVNYPTIIKQMLLETLQNVGNPFALNKFYIQLKNQGYQGGKDILYDYLEHLEDHFLAYAIEMYDKSGGKIRAHPKKIYAIDPGLIKALVLQYDRDPGRLFSNVIFSDLKRLGCKISYYLTHNRNEVDFVIETLQGQKKCLKIAWAYEHKTNFDREQRALDEAMNELQIEGELITLDSYVENGLRL